jgi:hypothetical protein
LLRLVAWSRQQKYEYAVITFLPSAPVKEKLTVSFDNKERKNVMIERTDFINDFDLSPPLKELRTMQDDGWELFNTQVASQGSVSQVVYYFYVRKKKQ